MRISIKHTRSRYTTFEHLGLCYVQVHGKRFAVLTRFVDELEASLNPDEANVGERSRPGNAVEQSDRDSSVERSVMQE